MSKTGRWLRPFIIALAGTLVPSQAAEFSRAFSEYPAHANPRALISGHDGYLYGTSAEFSEGRKAGGQVFRVAPDDDFRMLHRFDVVKSRPDKNTAGAFPTELFLMARDGCLYGLASDGGMFGQGVLYRLTPDGAFSVIAHLDPSQLPPGTLDSAYFVYSCRGFLEGPDDAFYTGLSLTAQQGIVRIGRDGKISLLANAGASEGVLTDRNQPRDLLCISAPRAPNGFVGQVQVTRFRAGGADQGIVETITSPLLDASFTSVWAMSWTTAGLIFRAEFLHHPDYSARVFLLKPDGSLETIADIGWIGGNGVLPYLDRFVHFSNDGTLYYASRWFSHSGASLIELKTDGTFRAVCGFRSGELIQAIPTPAGDLCGIASGSHVCLPDGGSGFSPDWMTDPSKHEVVHQHLGDSGFFFQVSLSDSPVVNSRPLAFPDVVKAKRSKPLIIRNLSNDWDPEGHELRMNHVVEPDLGHFDATSLQSLYQSQDQGRSSGFARYEVLDGTSAPSVGTILIRGNPSGTYLDPGLTLGQRAFMIVVKPDGTFTAGVPKSNGSPVIMTGKMDWYNRGLAQILLRSGESIAFSVHLVTDEGQPPALDYRIRNSETGETSGRATVVR